MQTNTHTPEDGSICGRHHRHWVAMPLFVAVALASASPAVRGVPAFGASAVQAHADQSFADAYGMWGVALQGAALLSREDGVQLGQGSILVSGDALTRVHVPGVDIAAVRGEMHVTMDGGVLTLASLSHPVLLSRPGGITVLMPGRQASWDLAAAGAEEPLYTDEAVTLPRDLLSQYLEQLRAARPEHAQAAALLPAGDLRSSPAELRAREAVRAIQTQMAEARYAEAAAGLAALQGMESLPADAAIALLQSALRAHDAPPSLLAPVLAMRADATVALLSHIDPALRDAAWSVPGATEQDLLAFPPSDTGADAADDLTVSRWHTEAAMALDAAEDPAALLSRILTAAAPAAETFDRMAYPDRKARYGAALRDLAASRLDLLDDASRANLALWNEETVTLEDVPAPLPEEPKAEPVVEVKAEPVAPKDPEALSRQAMAMLDAAGALITLETKADPVAEGVVHVSGAIFADASADHLYEFDLDLQKGEASAIRKDGSEPMPLPLPWDAFQRWVKGE